MAFGVFSYSGTQNIGDEIQSLAAWGRLPAPDYFLDRDNLKAEGDAIEGHASVIMNGWYGQWPENWPPSEKIRPLFVAIHITKEPVASRLGVRPDEYMLAPSLVKYLRRHAPIGARDLATLQLLQNAGIDAYFSGCMTLTLQRPDVARTDDLVVLNDLPQQMVPLIRERTQKPLFRVGHQEYSNLPQAERFARGRELLGLYARANCVITSRLHCALPCLAMGTPVLLVNAAPDQYRFAGLRELLHNCSLGQFLKGDYDFDINNPPPNKPDYLEYRNALIARVEAFVAGDASYVPTPDETYPTQADKDEAIRYIRAKKALPIVWRANRDTFLKAKVCTSSELRDGEKIAVQKGTILTGQIVSHKADHISVKNPTLNNQAITDQAWWACSGHFSEMTT